MNLMLEDRWILAELILMGKVLMAVIIISPVLHFLCCLWTVSNVLGNRSICVEDLREVDDIRTILFPINQSDNPFDLADVKGRFSFYYSPPLCRIMTHFDLWLVLWI